MGNSVQSIHVNDGVWEAVPPIADKQIFKIDNKYRVERQISVTVPLEKAGECWELGSQADVMEQHISNYGTGFAKETVSNRYYDTKYSNGPSGRVSLKYGRQMKIDSGWWSDVVEGGIPKKKLLQHHMWAKVFQLWKDSTGVEDLADTKRALAVVDDQDLSSALSEAQGVYVFENMKVPCFKYVGITNDSLCKRIYAHLNQAFTASETELLSLPLCLTHANTWKIQLIPSKLLRDRGFLGIDERNLLTFESALITAKKSLWPYGLNVKMEYTVTYPATLSKTWEEFVQDVKHEFHC
eukprot:m.309507 g.309507  ORF g.309507 m.309507 type:complete len:296 (+) comp46726_c0_seq1:192-1079(+)